MSQPIILAVDDDDAVARALARDLEKRLSPDYDIIVEPSPSTALDRLRHLRDEGTEVAVVIAGLWMEEQTGTQVLIHAHALHPEARRMLLVPFGDTSADEELVRATTLGQIDSFVSKPWASPDEWLYPAIGELLSELARTHLPCFEAIRVVGPRWSTEAHLVRDHLSRNPVPYGYYPLDSAEGRRLLQEFHLDTTRPILIGAELHTAWLPDAIARDARGFILPGRDLLRDGQPPAGWPLERPPALLETSLPGVFAVGDVRQRSMKRVASAVGEGATAISLIHEYLQEHSRT